MLGKVVDSRISEELFTASEKLCAASEKLCAALRAFHGRRSSVPARDRVVCLCEISQGSGV